MAGIFNVITKIFGNKYDKDLQDIQPIVNEIHKEYNKVSKLTDDCLLQGKIEGR